MVKKLFAIFMCVIMFACILSGCRGSDSSGKQIAMVTDYSTVEEDAFYLTIWKSMQNVADSYGISYSKYTTSDETYHARRESVLQAIKDGATLVILPSSTFADVLAEMQKEYPKVKFFAIDIGENEIKTAPSDNTYACAFREEQAGFLAGYAAVREGYTRLGFLGGVELPSITRFGYGYIQGADLAAQEMKVSIEIKYSYCGQFYGDMMITNQMRSWYSTGTQVVFSCGGAIYSSVLEAALESGGMMIGVDIDQRKDGTNYKYNPFLTSATKGLENITTEIVTNYAEGNWRKVGGRVQTLGLEQGDYVGLPTSKASWRFNRFSFFEYYEVCDRIKSDEINITSDAQGFPIVSHFTTIIIQ